MPRKDGTAQNQVKISTKGMFFFKILYKNPKIIFILNSHLNCMVFFNSFFLHCTISTFLHFYAYGILPIFFKWYQEYQKVAMKDNIIVHK